MKDKLGDKMRVAHILDAINNIENFVSEKSAFTDFEQDILVISACLHQLEIIGEASGRLSDSLRNAHSEVEWKSIIGLRNFIVHEYFGVNPLVIWEVITKDLPILKLQIEKIYQQL